MRQQYRRRSLCCRVVCGVLLLLPFASAEAGTRVDSGHVLDTADPENPYEGWDVDLIDWLDWLRQYLGGDPTLATRSGLTAPDAESAARQFIDEFRTHGIAADLTPEEYNRALWEFDAALKHLNDRGNTLAPETSEQLANTFHAAMEQSSEGLLPSH